MKRAGHVPHRAFRLSARTRNTAAGQRRISTGFPLYGREDDSPTLPARTRSGRAAGIHTATYVTGAPPGTTSARPSFTSRRTWASASDTAMLREP